MAVQPAVIAIVAKDMAASLAFYRLLGLDIPEGVENEPHVDITAANGYRIAWDSEELMRSIYSDWTAPAPGGQRVTLTFQCDTPAEVDELYARLEAAGYPGHTPPWDAFWGHRYAVTADPDGTLVDLFASL